MIIYDNNTTKLVLETWFKEKQNSELRYVFFFHLLPFLLDFLLDIPAKLTNQL